MTKPKKSTAMIVTQKPAALPVLISRSTEVQTPLPPILDGCYTLRVEEKVRRFVLGVPEMLERWITRRASPHTQRAYGQDLDAFIGFMKFSGREEAARLLGVTVGQVHTYRDWMRAEGQAPKTINRRISSLSGFFKYLREVAAEMRLPIQVANPADKEFVARDTADPIEERRHFSAANARRLFSLPAGETVLDYRDRAILKCLLYSGVRIGTLLRLDVRDFHADDNNATLRITEKGSRRRTIGLNVLAAESIRDYLKTADITSGPLFRPRLTAKDAGLVGLVAPNVSNSGIITAKLGTVHLASGDSFILDLYGDGLMAIQASDAVSQQLVRNTGTINAAGGTIKLTAAAGRQIVNSLIDVEGELHAPAVAQKNGTIFIYGEGSNAVKGNIAANKAQKQGTSTVMVSGLLDASGKNAGEKGGNIEILGDDIAILNGSYLDASGLLNGGNIKIGGDFHGVGPTPTASATVVQNDTTINANATGSGNGGNVVVWSDGYTNFLGVITARGGPNGGNGGNVETSGKKTLKAPSVSPALAAARAPAAAIAARRWIAVALFHLLTATSASPARAVVLSQALAITGCF